MKNLNIALIKCAQKIEKEIGIPYFSVLDLEVVPKNGYLQVKYSDGKTEFHYALYKRGRLEKGEEAYDVKLLQRLIINK